MRPWPLSHLVKQELYPGCVYIYMFRFGYDNFWHLHHLPGSQRERVPVKIAELVQFRQTLNEFFLFASPSISSSAVMHTSQ